MTDWKQKHHEMVLERDEYKRAADDLNIMLRKSKDNLLAANALNDELENKLASRDGYKEDE